MVGLRKFLANPVVITLSLLANFLGFPLTIYLYYAAQQYRQLTYYVHPVKAAVVRSGEASRLAATFDDKPVETDITAAQVAIWNDGSLPIKPDNLLKPVVISVEHGVPILEATIRKSSRDVTGLQLDRSELQNGRVTLRWNILERGDGGVVQLIYAGSADASIQVNGVVEGQQEVKKREFTGKIKSASEQYESEKAAFRLPAYGVLAGGIALALLGWVLRGISNRNRQSITNSYEMITSSYRKMYEGSIRSEQWSIDLNDQSIAQAERQIVEDEKKFSSEVAAMAKQDWLREIDRCQKERQRARASIEKINAEKEEKEKELRQELSNSLKDVDWLPVGFICVGLMISLAATYLLIVAHPAGPPFGF